MPRPIKRQIQKVIEYLLRNGAEGPVSRSLAWVLGNVPDEDYYHEVAQYVKELNRAKNTRKEKGTN